MTSLRLYTSNASPFCLKIMVLIRELGLTDLVELDYSVKAFPTSTTTSHSDVAPLGKIPALSVVRRRRQGGTSSSAPTTTTTTTLFGSQVIAQYLDHVARGPEKSLPSLSSSSSSSSITAAAADDHDDGDATLARFEALTTESLCDGICEAALALRYERLERPENLLWDEWVRGQLSKITRAVPMLSQRVTSVDPECRVLPLDAIAAAVSLYYVDRRAPDSNWRRVEGGERLDEWYRAVQRRTSWRETPFVR